MLINAQGTKLNTPPTIHFSSLEAAGGTRFLCLVPKQFHVCAHVWIMYVLSPLIFQSVRHDFKLVNLVLPQCFLSWLFIVKPAAVVAQKVKNLPAFRSPRFDPWVGKIPWRRKWQSTPIWLPGKSHEQRSLVGYSPWGLKELNTTERLHVHII